MSRCIFTGQIHFLRSLIDSSELKQEHLKLWTKCHRSGMPRELCQYLVMYSWLEGIGTLALPEVTSGSFGHTQPRCLSRCAGRGRRPVPTGWDVPMDPCSRAGLFPYCAKLLLFCACAPTCLCNWYVHTENLSVWIHSGVGTAAPSVAQLSTPQAR